MNNLPVLVIEDDPSVVAVVGEQIKDLGYTFVVAEDGALGLERALNEEFALIVLDLGLPSIGGLEICRQVREAKAHQAILILTGERGETKTVLGLELGADDYLQKPVRAMEFRARVRALLRRASLADGSGQKGQSDASKDESLSVHDLEINYALREVKISGALVELTPIEFDIFELLAQNPERVFSGDTILETIWGHTNYTQEQNVRSHISHIRKKLEEAGSKHSYITTKRGHGYRFDSN